MSRAEAEQDKAEMKQGGIPEYLEVYMRFMKD